MGVSLGGLFGGRIGNVVARHLPNMRGRKFFSQITIGVAILIRIIFVASSA